MLNTEKRAEIKKFTSSQPICEFLVNFLIGLESREYKGLM